MPFIIALFFLLKKKYVGGYSSSSMGVKE